MNPNPATRLFGLIGHPVAHSLGPVMHNAAFRALSLNAIYLAFDTENPAGCLAGMRAMKIQGLSVTLPHKTAILPFLDRVDETAERIGAVNTVVNDSGRLVGLNTDASGVLRAIRTRVEPRGLNVLVAGAGGVARAAAFALTEAGARVMITNRTASRGKALARELGLSFVSTSEAPYHEADILVQATSAGMEGTLPGIPLPLEILRPGLVVMETVYRPQRTVFLEEARNMGCRVIEGWEMFVRQGADQFRLWTGLEAPMEVMRNAVIECSRTDPGSVP